MAEESLIKETLDVTGWSKAGLAERVGVSKDSIQDWTQNRSHPRLGVYVDLKRELQTVRDQIDRLIDKLTARGA